MKEILGILTSPREVFEDIVDKPRWLIAVLFCSGTLFLIVWLEGCWQNLTDGLRVQSLLGPALISPAIVVIVAFGSTVFIYLACVVLGGGARGSRGFKTFLSINIHCGVIFLLGEAANLLLVRTNLLGGYSTPLPNRFPTGLDLFLVGIDEPNRYLAIILHCTSVFVLWYLVLLAKGIHVITNSGKVRAAVIVAGLWIVAVTIGLGMAYAAGGETTIRVAL